MNLNVKSEDWIGFEREGCKRSLADFVAQSWHVIEPTQPYIYGWHIGAIAEHLQAVTSGEISRLLLNVPPGMLKSLLTGVFWPAWEWGPIGRASTRYLAASHSHRLSIRDNLRMRRLVESDWYQQRWPIPLTRDQNEKLKFENELTGWREAVAMSSMTGNRSDRVILDDPHSVEGAFSDAELETTIRTFKETVPTRLNNPDKSAIIVIMQRLRENDVSGVILSESLGYTHVMLPMEFEVARRCTTSIGFTDPREKEGELLFPERFPREVVERDKKVMGSFATAGQFQQRPAPREGAFIKTDKVEIVDAVPANLNRCRAWDLAGTKGGGDYSAGVKMGRSQEGVFYVEDVSRFQGSPLEVESTVYNIATQDGSEVKIRIPQDPGQAGVAQAQLYIRKLAGFNIKAVQPTGSKRVRAMPFAAQVEAGNVKLLRGSWNAAFMDELKVFDNGTHDDQVDAASDAFNELSLTNRFRFTVI